MPILKQIVNEKAMNLNKDNTYVFASSDVSSELNKIQVTQLFAKQGIEVMGVRVVRYPAKKKTNWKTRKVRLVKRPKKFFVTLGSKAKKLEENFEINY